MSNDIKTAFETFEVMDYPTGGQVSIYTPSLETTKYNTVEQHMKTMSTGKAVYSVGSLTSSFVSKTQNIVVLSPVSGISFDGVIGNTRYRDTENITWTVVLPYEFSGSVYLYLSLNSSGSLDTVYSYQSNADDGMESVLGLYVVTLVLGVITDIQTHSSFAITDDTFHPTVFQDPHSYLLEQDVIQVERLSISPNKTKHYSEYCGILNTTVNDGDEVSILLPTTFLTENRVVSYTELTPVGSGEIVYASLIGDDTNLNYLFHGLSGTYNFYYYVKFMSNTILVFTGAIDGDLSKEGNYTPNRLPTSIDNVIVDETCSNQPSSGSLTCNLLSVQNNGTIPSVTGVYLGANCSCTGGVEFRAIGWIDGIGYYSVNVATIDLGIFYDNSDNYGALENCTFYGNSSNQGTVSTGNFYGNSSNQGVVEVGNFYGSSTNDDPAILTTGNFYENSSNTFGPVTTATFYDSSVNLGDVTDGTFIGNWPVTDLGSSSNSGSVANAVFTTGAINDTTGIVGTATFENNTSNDGQVTTGTFEYGSGNSLLGTVTTGIFNVANNYGDVGTATFNGGANRDSGQITNATFNDGVFPYGTSFNMGVVENAIFNGDSRNNKTVTNGTFNGTSQSANPEATVTNGTFNDSSYNGGNSTVTTGYFYPKSDGLGWWTYTKNYGTVDTATCYWLLADYNFETTGTVTNSPPTYAGYPI